MTLFFYGGYGPINYILNVGKKSKIISLLF